MLPSRNDPRWQALAERPEQHTYQFLALRILMQRVAKKAPGERRAAADELYAFFQKNERLVGADIAALFG